MAGLLVDPGSFGIIFDADATHMALVLCAAWPERASIFRVCVLAEDASDTGALVYAGGNFALVFAAYLD